MSTSPHLQLSTLPRPRDFTSSLADNLSSSTSVLSVSPSTQSPPDIYNLRMSIAGRIPPELLLDIFSIVSDSPCKDHDQYLERNRNLKSFALVHSSWSSPAKEILQEEVYFRKIVKRSADEDDLKRMPGRLVDSGNSGTKYLTCEGHLNDVTNSTGLKIWSQVRYLRLLTGSRSEDTSSMRDFVRFPQLEHLHLDDEDAGDYSWMKIYPSDSQLQFLNLRRITFSREIGLVLVKPSGGLSYEERDGLLLSIARKLFSPSHMPNLRHLAIDKECSDFAETLAPILHQITTLAIRLGYESVAEEIADHHTFDNLKHLSLQSFGRLVKKLLHHHHVELESLHLSSWMVADDEELLARLLAIAKHEDSHNRIGRIVIYGSRTSVETEYEDLVDELDAFEWREDREEPPFEDFDGR